MYVADCRSVSEAACVWLINDEAAAAAVVGGEDVVEIVAGIICEAGTSVEEDSVCGY